MKGVVFRSSGTWGWNLTHISAPPIAVVLGEMMGNILKWTQEGVPRNSWREFNVGNEY